MTAGETILVTGATGQIGYELTRELAPYGRIVATGRGDLDLADPDAIRAVVRRVRPGLIVNAAGYTAVDRAESEPELCAAVNARAPALLAEEANLIGAAIIHYSTDYVFDGTQSGRYKETDPPRPVSVYGQTKLAGEAGVVAGGAPHLILRTSWVYGARGHNFMRTILRLAGERTELRVVADQVGAPTWSRDIARATAQIVGARRGSVAERWPQASGVYHMAALGETSWHGFAEAILEHAPERARLVCERVTPISTVEYAAAAARPANSRLDVSKIRETFGVSLADWRTALRSAMTDLS